MTDKKPKEFKCKCPFCDTEISKENFPYCSSCEITIKFCSNCGAPIAPDVINCPECGQS